MAFVDRSHSGAHPYRIGNHSTYFSCRAGVYLLSQEEKDSLIKPSIAEGNNRWRAIICDISPFCSLPISIGNG
jgi:hypothetical protein